MSWCVSAFADPVSSFTLAEMQDVHNAIDAELVAEIAGAGAGAHAAEAELCRRFAPRIHLYGLRHLRDHERARDLIQVVLLAVLEAVRARRIDDPTRVDRFVLGTCRNSALRFQQRERRTPLATEAALAGLRVEPVSVELAPLYECLSQLETRARDVLTLSFVEDCSAEEIAAKLVLQTGNVRVIRHRALHAMRECLDGKAAQP